LGRFWSEADFNSGTVHALGLPGPLTGDLGPNRSLIGMIFVVSAPGLLMRVFDCRKSSPGDESTVRNLTVLPIVAIRPGLET
jgi:hypothetical protein